MSEQVQILCVDDERNVLRSLERVFLDDDFEIITAGSGEEGLTALEENPDIQLVVSDYRMPGMNGVEFLKEVCNRRPDTVRIVLSGYADTAAVVAAINEGQIYKFIPKPWNDDELRQTVIKAIEVFELQNRNRELAEELSHANTHLQEINDELEQMVARRTAELTLQNRALSHAQNVLQNLPVGVLAVVSDGVIVQANEEAAKLLATPAEKLVCERYQQVLPASIAMCVTGLLADGDPVCVYETVNDWCIQLRGIRMVEDGQPAAIIVLNGQCARESCNV
jgi:two-component system NtrC family sensor kinase